MAPNAVVRISRQHLPAGRKSSKLISEKLLLVFVLFRSLLRPLSISDTPLPPSPPLRNTIIESFNNHIPFGCFFLKCCINRLKVLDSKNNLFFLSRDDISARSILFSLLISSLNFLRRDKWFLLRISGAFGFFGGEVFPTSFTLDIRCPLFWIVKVSTFFLE